MAGTRIYHHVGVIINHLWWRGHWNPKLLSHFDLAVTLLVNAYIDLEIAHSQINLLRLDPQILKKHSFIPLLFCLFLIICCFFVSVGARGFTIRFFMISLLFPLLLGLHPCFLSL